MNLPRNLHSIILLSHLLNCDRRTEMEKLKLELKSYINIIKIYISMDKEPSKELPKELPHLNLHFFIILFYSSFELWKKKRNEKTETWTEIIHIIIEFISHFYIEIKSYYTLVKWANISILFNKELKKRSRERTNIMENGNQFK